MDPAILDFGDKLISITLDFQIFTCYHTSMNNKTNIKGLAMDAWIMAIPDNVYAPCPCGCGQKLRFVVKKGEEELAQHEEVFIQNYIRETF